MQSRISTMFELSKINWGEVKFFPFVHGFQKCRGSDVAVTLWSNTYSFT